MQRSPSYRWWLAAIFPSSPMAWSWVTARGVRPSPHVFSRGNVFFSTITTSRPARASQCPAAAPAGPPPMTRTSWRWRAVTSPVWRVGRATRESSACAERALVDPGSRRQLTQARLGEGHVAFGDLDEREVLLAGGVEASEGHPLVQHHLGQLGVGELRVPGHPAPLGLGVGAVGV